MGLGWRQGLRKPAGFFLVGKLVHVVGAEELEDWRGGDTWGRPPRANSQQPRALGPSRGSHSEPH